MYQQPYGQGQGGRGPGEDLKGGFATCAAAMVSIVISPPFEAPPGVSRSATRFDTATSLPIGFPPRSYAQYEQRPNRRKVPDAPAL